MIKLTPFALWPLLAAALPAPPALRPWQQVTVPTVAEAAAAFPTPPREYGAIHWAIWGGQQSKEKILGDIEHMQANGTFVIMIDNSRGLQPKYFSPEYLELVKFTVDECKKRGMKVWIEDDAGYPDGMAGGIISRDYPQLGMQAIVADARYSVAAGQTLQIPVPPDTLGILAYNRALGATAVPLPAGGQLKWTAPDPGSSELVFVRHVFRSSPTRYTNRADGTGDKDSLYSLTDYLNPAATRTYLKVIHEVYAKLVGDEFGKTVLGFRGDEPDYTGFMPWTPKLLETFQRRKGYDLQPYIAQFFAPDLTPEVLRAKADYWDVWSEMFSEAFFKPQAEWCEAHGMGYMAHLNHEEEMLDLSKGEDLVRNEGSFFRAMRYVDVPGIDNLNQIGPGIVADFPKLSTSAAHLFGRPQAWEEEGGSPGQAGKFIADYHYVRGVNFLNIRGLNNPPPAPAAGLLLNSAAAIAGYVNRASYLDAIGRPGAQVALYHPTDSMWLGDKEADDVTVRLVTELMDRQIDFDHIDEDSLASICTLDGGTFRNLSGQAYRAIVIPSSTVIQRSVLDRLRAFAAAGGKVVFVGRTPAQVVGRTFLHPESAPPDLSFATLEPEPHITDRVVATLPAPDVKLDAPCDAIKYTRRILQDGDIYFFFNESAQTQVRTAILAGRGPVQVWDATTGAIHPVAGLAADGSVALPLTLAPQEARFVVIGPLPAGAGDPFPLLAQARTLAPLDGDWSITLGDQQLTSALQTWKALGSPAFSGTALYRRDFTLADGAPAGRHVYLDLGNAHEIARPVVNGTALEPKAWPPYVWDVTAALKAGANTLEVQVQLTPAGPQRGFGGGNRRGETVPRERPKGFAPTGVPGGLGDAADSFGGRRERLAAFNVTAGPRFSAAAEAQATGGLLGPVRLLAP